ncbi:MAG: dockerin type I repeat-containing protein [Ruminococcus sp.]|nr:dockerin type I repeat-containing protein [Ruminococcus sp.]
MKKLFKQSISMLVVVCLLVGMCPAVFAAETEEKIKYISFGDSMTNGYGLTGYGNVNGYLEVSPDAYPYKISEYFGWDLTHQLAVSAMRAEDLHYILEYGKEGAYPGDDYTRSEFINGRFKNDCGGVENAAQVYQSATADADVISMGVGNANFGVFLLGRITNALGILGGSPADDAWIDFEDAIMECDETTKAYLRQIREMVKAKLYEVVPEESHEIIAPIENAVSYAVVSYMMNYAGCVDRIVELNPDVEIIIVGLMNTFTGMDLSYEGNIIPLGEVVGEAVEAINIYLSTQPSILQVMGKYPDAKFYYAESPDVEVIADTFASQIDNPESVLRERVYSEIMNMVWPMLLQMSSDYVNITFDEVLAYEKALNGTSKEYAEYVTNNTSKIMSIAVYLAFEKATIDASDLEVLDAAALIKLASGFGDVFNGLQEKVEAYMSENMDAEQMVKAGMVAIYLPDELKTEVYKFLALPDAMSTVLVQDKTIEGLLNLFARMLVGNGIGCHPSPAGHDALTAAIIDSYENSYTASDAATDKIRLAIDKILYALEKYGPQDSNYYEVTDDSYYVAIGDGSVTSTDYADYAELFAKENHLEYKNLAKSGLLIQDAGSVLVDNYADIAKADLITVGFSNVTLMEKALEAAINCAVGNPNQYDWSALVTEEGVAYVESFIEMIRAELVNSGISGTFTYTIGGLFSIEIDTTEFVLALLENYAYNALTYAYTMPEYVNAIREINPDAKVIVVGTYNPFKGRTLVFDGKSIAIGEYLEKVVKATTIHSKVYCSLTENVIFVEAPEVENASKGNEMEIVEFVGAIMAKFGLYPNQNGHTYIKDQLVNALDIEITKFPIGDVNMDGEVNVFDVTEIQLNAAGYCEFTDDQARLADVDFNGEVNIFDATTIQLYLAGTITEF